LTGSVAADGQTAMTGNLQMGNNKVTGLAVATATGDALSYNQAATVTTLTTTGNVTIGGTLTQIEGAPDNNMANLGFVWNKMKPSYNQSAAVGHIILRGELVPTDPGRQGKITGITTA